MTTGTLCVLMAALCCGVFTQSAYAQTIIRDREIEKTFTKWFSPVIEAAELNEDAINVILVKDNQINAFVAGGPNVFFYTGLLLETDDLGEIIGVFAHELGHIRGGHLIRGRKAMERASYEMIIGTLLGLGAAIATGEAGAASTLSAGSQSQAFRRYLSHSRVQESSADQAALNYLDKAGMNPEGLISFFHKLQTKHGGTHSHGAEYTRTHPLTANRIAALENEARKSPHLGKPWPDQWQEDYDRMKAKLLGFINPGHVQWIYATDDHSIDADYARAIAKYRQKNFQKSLDIIDSLIEREPQNPYFYELKGQVLVDAGRIEDSLAPYRRAVELDPEAGLIRTALAHALTETSYGEDKDNRLSEAIEHLTHALKTEKRSTRLHRLLATEYGCIGKTGQAKLHLSEEAVLRGKWSDAYQHAQAARRFFEQDTREHLQALDLIEYIEIQKKG